MEDFKINKEAILKALGTVQEPDLKKDLVTLNMIRDEEMGIEPFTPFEDISSDWECPRCGASKDDFLAVQAQSLDYSDIILLSDEQRSQHFWIAGEGIIEG